MILLALGRAAYYPSVATAYFGAWSQVGDLPGRKNALQILLGRWKALLFLSELFNFDAGITLKI
jgi:hypothetical protein